MRVFFWRSLLFLCVVRSPSGVLGLVVVRFFSPAGGGSLCVPGFLSMV